MQQFATTRHDAPPLAIACGYAASLPVKACKRPQLLRPPSLSPTNHRLPSQSEHVSVDCLHTMVSAYRIDALRDPTNELKELFSVATKSSPDQPFADAVMDHFSRVFEKLDAFREVCRYYHQRNYSYVLSDPTFGCSSPT